MTEPAKQIDLTTIEELATKATAGPWRAAEGPSGYDGDDWQLLNSKGERVIDIAHASHHNACYLAAVSPDVVLGLVEQCAEAQWWRDVHQFAAEKLKAELAITKAALAVFENAEGFARCTVCRAKLMECDARGRVCGPCSRDETPENSWKVCVEKVKAAEAERDRVLGLLSKAREGFEGITSEHHWRCAVFETEDRARTNFIVPFHPECDCGYRLLYEILMPPFEQEGK